MNSLSEFRAEKRADKAAEREQARLDMAARAELARRAEAERRKADRQAARDVETAKDRVAARRRARWARLTAWCGAHVVELLIYPLALVSFVLAAPAMARFGYGVYGSWLGVLLPVLTEGGMWAFALAVLVSRRRHPDRPVGMLQVGVWVFAAVAFTLNVVHGLATGVSAGVVMGVAAIAGILAHQLTLATPPRGRIARADARIAKAAHRKVVRVRRAAIRHAVAELDAEGTARLIYTPGRYVLTGRGRRLEHAISLTTDDTATAGGVDWDAGLAALTAVDSGTVSGGVSDVSPAGEDTPGSGVALAEHPGQNTSGGDGELAHLVARVRAAIAAGDLPAEVSQRRIRAHLGVRATRAAQVWRALHHNHEKGGQ